MAKRVTIHDVAAAAGVSRQTVTRAVNGMSDISETTRQRVLDESARLGYRPSRFARNLVVRNKTYALGYLVSSFRNPYYTDTAGEMLTAAGSRGWQVVMASPVAGSEADVIEVLSNQVDALVGHFALPEERLLEIGRGIPVVMLERHGSLPGVHSVEVDLRAGVRDAMEQLRARGARRLGMIDSDYSTVNGPYAPSPRREWFEEFADPEFADAVAVGHESIGGGAGAFTELLTLRPELDAVIVFNDMMAIGAIQAADRMGISVPARVRIVGIDGLALGEAVKPALTSLSIDRRALVTSAIDILEILAQSDFQAVTSISRVTQTSMLWRESA